MAAFIARLLVVGCLVYLTVLVAAEAAVYVDKPPNPKSGATLNKDIIIERRSGNAAHSHGNHRPLRIHSSGRIIPPSGSIPPTAEERAKLPKHPSKSQRSRVRATLPTGFDARKQWPQCASLSLVRDQGGCGTCWAVSAASVMSDRLCIATNGALTDLISGWQSAGCSNLPSTDGNANCNDGGNSINAFMRAALYGMNSGGEYNSNIGCVPYQVTYSDPLPAIDCKTACSNPSFTSPSFPVDDMKHYPDSTWGSYLEPGSDGVTIAPADMTNQVTLMKTEILNYGSVGVSIDANDDFCDWTYADSSGNKIPFPGSTGVTLGQYVQTDHAVKVIGWNRTAAGVEYWIGANSWGTSWQDQGFFYVTTGQNVIGIEQDVTSTIVNASAFYSCSSATFCTQPIDTAVQMDYTTAGAPLFLFQGNCAQQVQISGSGIAKVGTAVPIIKKFVMSTSPPITSWNLYWNEYATLTSSVAGSGNCQILPGTTKYSCADDYSDTPAAYTVISASQDIRYANDGNINSGAPGGGWYSWALSPANFFTGNGMATVTGFLKQSATNMLVFGKSSTGAAVTGVVNYSKLGQGTGQFTWVTKPTTPSTFLAC